MSENNNGTETAVTTGSAKRAKAPGLWERAHNAASWLLANHKRPDAELYIKVAAVLVMVDGVHALKAIASELGAMSERMRAADLEVEVDAPEDPRSSG